MTKTAIKLSWSMLVFFVHLDASLCCILLFVGTFIFPSNLYPPFGINQFAFTSKCGRPMFLTQSPHVMFSFRAIAPTRLSVLTSYSDCGETKSNIHARRDL